MRQGAIVSVHMHLAVRREQGGGQRMCSALRSEPATSQLLGRRCLPLADRADESVKGVTETVEQRLEQLASRKRS
jgi:hypothetical protein